MLLKKCENMLSEKFDKEEMVVYTVNKTKKDLHEIYER
jgi:hypothetical protein